MTPEDAPTVGHRCAVLGSPIAHSLSPALHSAAYAALGLVDWRYEAYDVDESGLAGFVAGCDARWRGLSLTMPLKVAALALGEVDPLAAQAGAANTLISGPGGTRRLLNTDVGGAGWALVRAGVQRVSEVTLLGAGATARSVLVAVAQRGARSVTVLTRTPARAASLAALAGQLGVEMRVVDWAAPPPPADLLASTVTAGAADARAADLAERAAAVFDVVYDPWPTPLARAARFAGRTVVSGLDLLVGQALDQVRLMTGSEVAAEVLYDAGRAELDRRRAPTAAPAVTAPGPATP
ncbi:MAG: shikimate dehydrogenase [Actinomycetes bacterium]